MKLGTLPNTTQGKIFEKMVKAGFEPLKTIIEYERLENELNEQDIELLIHAIGQGIEAWIHYLKQVNAAKAERGGE